MNNCWFQHHTCWFHHATKVKCDFTRTKNGCGNEPKHSGGNLGMNMMNMMNMIKIWLHPMGIVMQLGQVNRSNGSWIWHGKISLRKWALRFHRQSWDESLISPTRIASFPQGEWIYGGYDMNPEYHWGFNIKDGDETKLIFLVDSRKPWSTWEGIQL